MLAKRILDLIQASGMTQQDFAKAIGLDPTALSKALSGKRNFKPLEIALIADQAGVPAQHLLSDEVHDPEPATVAARTQPQSSPVVEQALGRAFQMLELDELLCELGFGSKQALRTMRLPDASPYKQGEFLAEKMRDRLGVSVADLPRDIDDLATDLEAKLGIDVAIEPLTRGLDGLAVTHRKMRLILVSSSIRATRQRYTLAHELAHLLAGDGTRIQVNDNVANVQIDENITCSGTPAEKRAQAFAAAFLMPAAALRSALAGRSGPPSEEVIAELLGRYRVSLDALAFRLHNARIVDAAGRDHIRRMASVRISLRDGRTADLQARHDRRRPEGLLSRAIDAYANGRISIRPIADLMDEDPDDLLGDLAPPRLAPVGHAGTEPALMP
jgi:Zn-dependent peptidase ImmA (M78 family)/predicted transcriptional regulator